MLAEPVRGGFPDPSFFSLSGIDQLRAYQRGLVLPAPGGYEVITSTLAVHHVRPCTMSSESVIARGRVLNTSRTFTIFEVLVEDALGRALAHISGSALVRRMQPPPPGPPPPLEAVDGSWPRSNRRRGRSSARGLFVTV